MAGVEAAIKLVNDQISGLATRIDQLHAHDTSSSEATETLRQVVNTLRKDMQTEIRNMLDKVNSGDGGGQGGGRDPHGSHMRLINDKDVKPPHLGIDPESKHFREWSKRITNYLNGLYPGFKKVLDWARDSETKIFQDDVDQLTWKYSSVCNERVYDLFLKILHNESLSICEEPDNSENGLEVFRRLHIKWDPRGAAHDMTRYWRIMHQWKAAKTLVELPGVIRRWEAELRDFTQRARDFPIPDRIKSATLLTLLPDQNGYSDRIREQFNEKPKGFDVLRQGILDYVQNNTGVPAPMALDALGNGAATPTQPPACYPADGEWDYNYPADDDWQDEWADSSHTEWAEWYTNFDEAGLAALGKGKGKGGKSKGGKGGKGKGKKGKGKDKGSDSGPPKTGKDGKPQFQGYCRYCNIWGHREIDCRKKIKDASSADKEDDKDAASLTNGGDLGDLDCGPLDRYTCGGCDCNENITCFECDPEVIDDSVRINNILGNKNKVYFESKNSFKDLLAAGISSDEDDDVESDENDDDDNDEDMVAMKAATKEIEKAQTIDPFQGADDPWTALRKTPSASASSRSTSSASRAKTTALNKFMDSPISGPEPILFMAAQLKKEAEQIMMLIRAPAVPQSWEGT